MCIAILICYKNAIDTITPLTATLPWSDLQVQAVYECI